MLYVTMTFWLLATVFAAAGILRLWSGMIAPKLINMLLLPGTVVAELGHITGVLLTGGSMDDVKKLIAADTVGGPQDPGVGKDDHVLGAAIVALLPMLACGLCLYLVMMLSHTGSNMLLAVGSHAASSTLPTSLTAFWDWLHGAMFMVESVSRALTSVDYDRLETWLFVYVLTCLTIRLAPLPGTQRGAVLAILIVGALAGIGSLFSSVPQQTVEKLWHLGSFAAAMLLWILLLSLGLRGGVGLIRLVTKR